MDFINNRLLSFGFITIHVRQLQKNYTDTINSFKEQQLISSEIHDRYQYLLKLKDYESRRMLNEDTAFYRQMEPGIADKYIRYPSYREFLDYYLWF